MLAVSDTYACAISKRKTGFILEQLYHFYAKMINFVYLADKQSLQQNAN
jgi:hypothetical protein